MNINKIHQLFVSSKTLLLITVVVFIAVRLYPVYDRLDNVSILCSLLIQIGIAFLLLQLNYIFNIIQQHTFLPTLFYLLFVGINPNLYYDLKENTAAICFVLCYYFLFDSYQKPHSQIFALNISLLLVLGSLLWTPLLLFFPVIWIGFYRFHSFNLRVFFASLIGIVIVYLFVLTWSVIQNDENIFFSLLPQFDKLFLIHKPNLTVLEWITSGLLLFTCLAIGLNLFFYNVSERVWTISVLRYLFVSILLIFTYFFLQSDYKSTLGLIIYVPIAFLCGYYFSRSSKREVLYLLLFIFLFFVGIGFAQHISS